VITPRAQRRAGAKRSADWRGAQTDVRHRFPINGKASPTGG
jgi:hypothetical protein